MLARDFSGRRPGGLDQGRLRPCVDGVGAILSLTKRRGLVLINRLNYLLMVPMRKVDPIKQQERRRHILNAAAHCFAEHGFHGTSTAQICERAGMSPGNLFHYYRSKADIIEALIAADTEATRDVIQAACASPDARARARLAGRAGVAVSGSVLCAPGHGSAGRGGAQSAVHALVIANEAERKQASRRCWHRHGAGARRDAAAAAGRNGRHDPAAAGWHFQPPRGRSRIRRQGRTSPDRERVGRYLPSDTAAGGRK